MPDEITFFDLAALIKIKPGTTVEKYGGMINSSFFDGANVLGTLSQKKLVSLSTAMPDQNPITITDVGKQLINEAEGRSKGEFDHLDLAILTAVSSGKTLPLDIGKAVNVRPKDLAMHLYKLNSTDFLTYEFVTNNVNIMLTEKGFAQVKAGMPQKAPPPQSQSQQQGPHRITTIPQPPEMLVTPIQGPPDPTPIVTMDDDGSQQEPPKELQPTPHKSKLKWIALLIIIVIIAVVGYMWYKKIKPL